MAYTTINKSTDYFNTKLYTGNGTTDTAITGVGFQPDLTWFKGRTNTENHFLFDAVRGATKRLIPNGTSSEATETNSMKSFDSDGFTLGTMGEVNQNTINYASWNWKANGAGSSNTDGDVTSTVSANQTAGFSIVTVSNLNSNSFGHGLGAEPHLVIGKRTDDVANWRVYYKGIASGKSLFLNSTAGETTEGSRIASANSSTVTVTGSGNGGSAGTGTAVYYCFAPKKGFSKIGTYTGNGNADGAFVYTGFKPAFVMIKATSGTENWQMYDNKRLGYNVDNNMLRANLSNAEQTDDDIDILSNGFKLRRNSGAFNNSGSTYIYIAIGQSLVGSNNVPCTAR